ncbi:GntR family transcriptional regulator [Pseudodonghicola flavimaris]|uniref:GntR family transcriptional regulator n=1 Tax=Pseudodonghicola flavimaris TaxID=3050036 RepID=A0ABT7F1T1_9RHOB|nr:GntR family transcriptional regulator [Pseudodonghicola flavimaris]MDK3018562.1 GntR family transcriptional regulator [Pseudodonghicola flavimaris]
MSGKPVDPPFDAGVPAATDGLSRGEAVYEGMKSGILHHRFRMGDPLREEDVASWFGASRAPARDALKRLETEGLVERIGRKYAVRNYSYDEVLVTYRMRAALEHMSVEFVIRRAGDAEIAALEAELEAQKAVLGQASRGEFSELDARFHMALARLSGNEMLLRETETVLNRARLIRSNELDKDNGPAAAYADHCRIYAALMRRDADTAKAELNYHYATTVRLHQTQPVDALGARS